MNNRQPRPATPALPDRPRVRRYATRAVDRTAREHGWPVADRDTVLAALGLDAEDTTEHTAV